MSAEHAARAGALEPIIVSEKSAIEVSDQELEKISQLTAPNQVLAIVQQFAEPDLLVSGSITLALEGIRDPGNMGTSIRIADWFGVSHIVCSLDCVDQYNPKVIQASMGSLLRVKVFYKDLSEILTRMPADFPVYGAVLDGQNIMNENLQTPGIIVIGNESKGISGKVLSSIPRKIKIPAFSHDKPVGNAESLNASVAAALICYEFRRSASPE